MLFSASLLITTTDSLAVASFCTIGSERLVSSPHFGHANKTVFSLFLGTMARWHFGQNSMMRYDRIAPEQSERHLTLLYFGENPSNDSNHRYVANRHSETGVGEFCDVS